MTFDISFRLEDYKFLDWYILFLFWDHHFWRSSCKFRKQMSSGFTVGWEVQSCSLDKTATTFFLFFISYSIFKYIYRRWMWERVCERESVCSHVRVCKYGSQPFECIQLGGVNTIPTSQGIRTPSSHIQRVFRAELMRNEGKTQIDLIRRRRRRRKRQFLFSFLFEQWFKSIVRSFFCP